MIQQNAYYDPLFTGQITERIISQSTFDDSFIKRENNIVEAVTFKLSNLKIIEEDMNEIKTSNLHQVVLPKIIIAIDNDECIGSWADLSLLYNLLKKEFDNEPDIDLFVKIMTETSIIRPYVKDFFHRIIKLKNEGIVHKVFMFTAASNICGWVIYLSKILERWIGESFYDEIIYREMIDEWHYINKSIASNSYGYIKNMDMIREIVNFKYNIKPIECKIIAIDDRPLNIINGFAVGVTPYNVAINIFQVLKLFLPDKFELLMSKYDSLINESWEKYLKNPLEYTKIHLDNQILLGIEYIEKVIFE